MTPATERPAPPRCCDELGCAHDPRAASTVPAQRPDPVAAYATALRTAWRALEIVGRHAEGLTPAQVAEGLRLAREGLAG